MKKIVVSLLTVCTLIFASCSNDDDSAPQNVSLDGTWKLTAWNVEEGFDFDENGTASTNILDEVNCLNNEQLIISTDGTASVISTSYLDIEISLVTGTTNEYEYDIDCEQENESDTISYTQNGGIIVFNYYGELINGTISGNQLFIVLPEGLEIYDEDFTTVVAAQDITFVYTKQ